MNSIVPEYKYDYELSSKRKTFLWLYQVLPSIDIIKYIYEIKENLEREDNMAYHGLCPRNVKIMGAWIPKEINGSWKIMNLKDIMSVNSMLMKLIVSDGLICVFDLPKPMTQLDRELIVNGFWEYCAMAVDYEPSLKDKILCINKILSEAMYFLPDICEKLNNIGKLYDEKTKVLHDGTITEGSITEEQIEEQPDFIRIGLDNNKNWHIPVIYF
jgi:hypothetical protein